MWIVEEVSTEGEKTRWEVRLVSSVGVRVRSYPSDGTTSHLEPAGGGRVTYSSLYSDYRASGGTCCFLVSNKMDE